MTKKNQIILCYLFHAVLIILGFFLLQEYFDTFLSTVCILYALYLVVCVVTNRKSYMPWILLLHHVIGFGIDFLLHLTGAIRPDLGFFAGLGEMFYFLSIPVYLGFLALTNSILFVIYRGRK